MRNARQIKEIVVAAFGPQIFETDTDAADFADFKSDYQELAHGWKALAETYGQGDTKLMPSILKVGIKYWSQKHTDSADCLTVASSCTGCSEQHGQQL